MFKRINALPRSLMVVSWLNLAIGVIGAIQTVAAMQILPANQTVVNSLNVLCSVLVVLGILQRSKFIRIITLVLSWMAVVSLGIAAIGAFFMIGLQVIVLLIPLLVSGVTIWGLTTKEARIYFGLDIAVGQDSPPGVAGREPDRDPMV